MLVLQLKNGLTKTETPFCWKNNGPHITGPLIFWFLIMRFNLSFHNQFELNGYVYILEIVLGILDKLIHNSRNVCGCLILNKLYIKLASSKISLTNNKQPTRHQHLHLKQKDSTEYSSYHTFVYLNRNFHLLEI